MCVNEREHNEDSRLEPNMDSLFLFGCLLPAFGQVDAWFGTARAPQSQLTWFGTVHPGGIMATPSSFQHLEMAPFSYYS